MNDIIAETVRKMQVAGDYAVLLKGQGVVQCYERPMWRACGDVDFLLSEENYEKAKTFFAPIATIIGNENEFKKDLDMTVGSWGVELHGTMNT